MVLEDLGLWDEYGAGGWPGPSDEFLPQENTYTKKTDSGAKLSDMYTPELMKKVKGIYQEDYQIIEGLGLSPDRPVFRRACTASEEQMRN